jgi:N-acetylmuramic acid 6-phosphate etherase
MTTEDISPRYLDLDLWNNIEALRALYEGQLAAVAAVGPALPAIAAAVDAAAPRLGRGGRLVYVGAGTSARIGAQDGAELAPTLDWPPVRLVLPKGGGDAALLLAIEGAEDSADAGAARMDEIAAGADDVVLGLAASGATAFTLAAMKAARQRGALTIGIANNPGSALLEASEHAILLDTGAEPIAGSTRLKAGTAQKAALNLFSTLTMLRLGKVYRGMMVHMRPTNAKLRRRAVQMVARITGCGEDAAAAALAQAHGDVKLATLIVHGLDRDRAAALMEKHGGNLRAALGALAGG